MPLALIAGITGQDGPYPGRCSQRKDMGIRDSLGRSIPKSPQSRSIFHPFSCLRDLRDLSSLIEMLELAQDKIYSLAVGSFASLSFEQPEVTAALLE